MTKHYKLASIGKGTVLHDDWQRLSFSIIPVSGGFIASLTGEETDCDAWADRNRAEYVKETEAVLEINIAEMAGLNAEKTDLNSRITAIDVRLKKLTK